MNDKTIRRVLAFFLLIVVVFIAVAVIALKNINRSAVTSDWVNHTHAVILQTEALRSALYVGDAAAHSFATTGDTRAQATGGEALSKIAEALETIKALTRHEPAQKEQIVQLESLVDQRAAFIREILATRPTDHPEKIRALLAADATREASQEIERKIERLKDDELTLLSERDTASYLQAQTTRWTVWSGVALNVFLLAGVAWLIRDDLSARRQVALTLQQANELLETKVSERTAGLAAANDKLSTENLERQWANQALEQQLRYNNLIINSINDLVLVLTKVRNISRINSAVVHLTGLEPSDLINQPLSLIVRLANEPGGMDAPMADPIARALRDGRDLRDQPAVVEDKRGRLTHVRFTLFPLRDNDKVVGGVVTLQIVSHATETKA